jgi:cellulose synthase/poly-beta-1,6-N-acetylglucosamine synthase-like glycosyltransferase
MLTAYIASKKIKQAEAKNWLEKGEKHSDFDKVNHVIVIPNYKETEEKLRRIVGTIAAQTFPLQRIYVVLAMEKREESGHKKATKIIKDFENIFGGIYATYHPDILGEVKGKSSNESYAAKEINKILIDTNKINVNYTTITTADADSMFDRQYFAYLGYDFLREEKRYK